MRKYPTPLRPDQDPTRLTRWSGAALPGCSPELLPGLDEATRSRVHVFNAFFLQRLRTCIKHKRDLAPLLGWIKGVDLFKKAGHYNVVVSVTRIP